MATKKKATKKVAKKKAGKKKLQPTREEMRQRLDFVDKMLAEHNSDYDTMDAIEQKYDVVRTTAEGYLRQVRERWAAPELQTNVEQCRAGALRRMYSLAQRNKKDWRCVMESEKMIMKLEGTEAASKLVVYDYDVDKLSDRQLERLVNGEDPALVLQAAE